MKTLEEREERERHRCQVVKNAVLAADRIIMEGSDGTCEETNFLTVGVAEKLMEKALHPLHAAMLHRDLE